MDWKIKKFRQFKSAVVDDFEEWYDLVRSSSYKQDEKMATKQCVQENLKRLQSFIENQS
jgi:hypothetical protein